MMFLNPFKPSEADEATVAQLLQEITDPRLKEIIIEEKKIPKLKLFFIFYMLAVKIMMTLFLGGRSMDSLLGI